MASSPGSPRRRHSGALEAADTLAASAPALSVPAPDEFNPQSQPEYRPGR